LSFVVLARLFLELIACRGALERRVCEGTELADTQVVKCFALEHPNNFQLLVRIEGLGLREGMRAFTAIVERDSETNLYVGYVPGFSGAHSQGETLDELHENLREVIEMLLEDEQVVLDAEFVGTQQIVVG
jgi:predicted RNase H-like HicB family nuclease